MKWKKDDALKDINSNFLAFPHAMLTLHQQDNNWFSTFSCLIFYEHLFKLMTQLQAGSELYSYAKNATLFLLMCTSILTWNLFFPTIILLFLS